MDWDFDISKAPRGKTVIKTKVVKDKIVETEVYEYDRVILATKCGMVTISRWLPVQPDRPIGRWEMLGDSEQPVAWMPFPTHPQAQA